MVEMTFVEASREALREMMQAEETVWCVGEDLGRGSVFGQSRAPMVVRKPIGLWRSSAAQHSQSLESRYVHIPGLVVVCAATPQNNYSMMKGCDPLR